MNRMERRKARIRESEYRREVRGMMAGTTRTGTRPVATSIYFTKATAHGARAIERPGR